MSTGVPKKVVYKGHTYVRVASLVGHQWQSDRPHDVLYAPPEMYKGVEHGMLMRQDPAVHTYLDTYGRYQYKLEHGKELTPEEQRQYEYVQKRLDTIVDRYKKEFGYK